ncbi:CHAT domain-containing protein [Streptomyces sp. SID3343]|uniref:CHAT domain-containing protein n=1 Tax=Streptomyces sp. SID3343 TaxID=2690260 RepID=UPI00137063FA|nr:CHAT domain-containing protein [Streptomyces sp. SID3343]MYW02404.1 CHAT domain-containing protein [Streptomyces sp. SID3343]
MLSWYEVWGVLGIVLVVLCTCGRRVAFVDKYWVIGFAIGFCCCLPAAAGGRFYGFGDPDTADGGWLPVATYVGFAIASFGMIARLAAVRGDLEPAVDRATEAEEKLRWCVHRSDPELLDETIESFRSAVGLTARPEHVPGPLALRLDNLGHARHATHLVMALRLRYERFRRPGDLDEAIDVARRTQRARWCRGTRGGRLLSELAGCLRLRYDHLGAAADLAEAESAAAEAVRLVKPGSPHFAPCRAEAAAVARSRYVHAREPRHLDVAVDQLQDLLEVTRRRGYTRAADLTTLCRLLVHRGEVRAASTDLDRAVDAGRTALDHTGPGHALFDLCQNNLALALRTRYEVAHRATRLDGEYTYLLRSPTADLDEAIRLAERAAAEVSVDAPGRADHRLNLALALHARHDREHDAGDLRRAIAAAREATEHAGADIPTRLRAGLVWSDIAVSAVDYPEAVSAFESVVALLPRLAPRELRRVDQEFRLGRWAGIAVAAAACALAEGRPDKAVALLEQGRGVLLSRTLDTRSDLTALRAEHPRLAKRFTDLREALDSSFEPADETPTRLAEDVAAAKAHEEARRRRRVLAEDWDELLERIRAEPNFAEFARTPSFERCLAQSHQGPVVYVNVTALRSDAIILEAGRIRTVRLAVRPADAARWTSVLHDAVAGDRIVDLAQREPVFDVLAWLWDTVAEPVLDAVAAPTTGGSKPRMWWIPTGPLALLPIHAAGHHRPGDGRSRSLLDRTIPSYAPTVRSLAAARARRPTLPASGHPLVVAMTRTPGAEPLPQAAAEAEAIRGFLPDTRILADRRATRDRVLADLPRHAWAHFACHAASDHDAPSRGRLLLHDHRERPLTVADIAGLDLGAAELIYLSSCDSARTGSRHADEAIHLASAFQLAGFSQVVATLWPVVDRFALAFATDVYRKLAHGDQRTDAAAAVHRATLEARAQYPNLPGLWAGHVHVGS